jgi:hypothetical protein
MHPKATQSAMATVSLEASIPAFATPVSIRRRTTAVFFAGWALFSLPEEILQEDFPCQRVRQEYPATRILMEL